MNFSNLSNLSNLSVKLNKSVSRIIKDSGINDAALLFAADEARRLMDGYVPMNAGVLCGTARVFVENGRGVVNYTQPYAAFCYYGDKKKFSRDKHEKASAYWDKAMLLSHKGDLTKSVSNYIKKQ